MYAGAYRRCQNEQCGQLAILALNGVVLLFTSWVLSILYTQAGLPLLVSKLASAMAGALINFTGSRWWVFRLSQD
ncbi:hypothetical protein DVH26_14215 [Paenibacillus sp. H1-7]|nr:hypothetical protein DVH26_14215 [Paenibacillus sp. H1-7]